MFPVSVPLKMLAGTVSAKLVLADERADLQSANSSLGN